MPAPIAVIAAAVLASLGTLGICRLVQRRFHATAQQRELALAHEVVAGMRDVALRLAADVSHHSTHVQEINAELVSSKTNDVKCLLDAMTRLVHVNENLQQRLSDAESRLQEHAEVLNGYAAEARTDALTALPNRHAMDAEMALHFERFQQYGIPLSVVMLDIDNFKALNDQFGHLCGDGVLREIARILLRTQGKGDMVARFGGEEFVVTLPASGLDEAVAAAERVRDAVQRSPLLYDGREFHVTVSAGVAQLRAREASAALLHRADQALFAAKRAGRNATCWHDGNAIRGPRARTNEDVAPPYNTAAETEKAENPGPMESKDATAAVSDSAALCDADLRWSPSPGDQPTDVLYLAECDRNRMFVHVRQRIAEWQRTGEGFAIILLRVHSRDGSEAQCCHAVRLLLGANLRDMDVVGRYAPNCYILLLPRTGLDEAEMFAARLRQAAGECVVATKTGPQKIALTLAATAIVPGDDAVGILRRAESALTAAEPNRACCGDGAAAVAAFTGLEDLEISGSTAPTDTFLVDTCR